MSPTTAEKLSVSDVAPTHHPGPRPAGADNSLAGVGVAYRWELVKLAAQVRNQVAFGLCLLAPFLFVAALRAQSSVPADTLFGRWVHDSGFAIPLVVLGFSVQWALPALTSIVAGDIFAAEDRYGTWKTILTRSRTRAQIFAAKTLAAVTYAIAATALLGLSSLAAGVLLVNREPLVGLGGDLLSPGRSAGLVLASWASVLPPVLAFTALGILLSIATRNSAIGIGGPVVVGLAMQLASMSAVYGPVRDLLLPTPFAAWHGFFVTNPFYGPFGTGLVVCAGYVVVCLGAGYRVLRRRDIARSS